MSGERVGKALIGGTSKWFMRTANATYIESYTLRSKLDAAGEFVRRGHGSI
jgi:hypothetical protein